MSADGEQTECMFGKPMYCDTAPYAEISAVIVSVPVLFFATAIHLSKRSTEPRYFQVRIGACAAAVNFALLFILTAYYRNMWVLGVFRVLKTFSLFSAATQFVQNCVHAYFDIVREEFPVSINVMRAVVASTALDIVVVAAVAANGSCRAWMLLSVVAHLSFLVALAVFSLGSLVLVHKEIAQHIANVEAMQSPFHVVKLKRALLKIRVTAAVCCLALIQRIVLRREIFVGETPASTTRSFIVCDPTKYVTETMTNLLILLIFLWHTNVKVPARAGPPERKYVATKVRVLTAKQMLERKNRRSVVSGHMTKHTRRLRTVVERPAVEHRSTSTLDSKVNMTQAAKPKAKTLVQRHSSSGGEVGDKNEVTRNIEEGAGKDKARGEKQHLGSP